MSDSFNKRCFATGSRLYSAGGRRGCQKVWAHQSWEACAQLHDGHSALQKGPHLFENVFKFLVVDG